MNKSGLISVLAASVALTACEGVGAYNEYTLRSKVSEALNQAAPLKIALAEYVLVNDKLPDGGQALGLPLPIVSAAASVDYADGAILIRFGSGAPSALLGKQVAIVPSRSSDSIRFACGYATAGVPSDALGSADAAQLTSVPPNLLPASCR